MISRKPNQSQFSEDNKLDFVQVRQKMLEVSGVPQGIYDYGGSTCFSPLSSEGINQMISQVHPQFILRYVDFEGAGCSGSIKPLLEDKISFVHRFRTLEDNERKIAQEKGIELETIPIAIDGVAVFSNNSVGIESLSIDQVRDIFLGIITNWQQVGGENLPINVVTISDDLLSDLEVLGLDRVTDSANKTKNYTSAIREVAKTPGAISLASAALISRQNSIKPLAIRKEEGAVAVSPLFADGKVNLPALRTNAYPLNRKFRVVIRRDNPQVERAGIVYVNLLLSEEGQQILERAGFVPLH